MIVTGAKGRTVRAAAVIAAAALSLASFSPAFASDKDAKDQTQAQQSEPKPTATPTSAAERKICINVEVSGSRMPHKACKTRAQWEGEGVDLSGN